jgi:hypothetical protein
MRPVERQVRLMPKTKRMKDGEGISIEKGKIFRFSCCDCGLTHDMVLVTYENEPELIGLALRRNNRATSAMRRWKKREA